MALSRNYTATNIPYPNCTCHRINRKPDSLPRSPFIPSLYPVSCLCCPNIPPLGTASFYPSLRAESCKFSEPLCLPFESADYPARLASPASPRIAVICRVKLIDSSFAFAPGHPISISKYLLPPLTFPGFPRKPLDW